MVRAILRVDVGLIRRKEMRRVLNGLKSRGAQIEWTEGTKWAFSSEWTIRGPLKHIMLVKALGDTENQEEIE